MVAILDGRLAPINPGDPKDMHIFVFNNIFISYGVDMKESFKVYIYIYIHIAPFTVHSLLLLYLTP